MAAKQKETTKPLLATKHDFVASLDALIQEFLFLDQCLRIALENNLVDASIKDKLADAHKRAHNALFMEWSGK